MKYLLTAVLLLLCATIAQAVTCIGFGGSTGPSCSGVYGNQNTTNSGFDHGGNAAMVLRKITIDCSGSNPYVNVRTYYVLNNADYQVTLVIYNSSGSRVAYSAPFQDPAAADPWYAVQSRQLTASLSAGDYWVGVLTESPLTYASEGGTSGDYRIYEPGWADGVPPATLDTVSASGTGAPIIWLSF